MSRVTISNGQCKMVSCGLARVGQRAGFRRGYGTCSLSIGVGRGVWIETVLRYILPFEELIIHNK